MSYSLKTAISLPKEDFLKIELYRKKFKKSRSEIIQEAVREWFQNHALKEKEKQYLEGYSKHPEKESELSPLFNASLGVLEEEEW